MVLGERLLDLIVGEFALLNLDLGLVLERVDLGEEHLAAGLLLLVHLIAIESLLNLLLDLQEFHLPLLHHLLSQLLVVVLQFPD